MNPAPLAHPSDRPTDWWTPGRWRIALLLLVIATFVIRARYFGNPLIDVDEEYYLLTGERMLRGAIPYVDLWDRKPVGLFLLYAGMRLLGGAGADGGIYAYQIVASGFAAATAVMIAIIARRISTPGAALIAGLVYVPALAMSGGQGGQTPVFYNLPVAVAVWLVLGLAAIRDGGPARPAAIVGRGAAAMLLVGIAMQIKYTAVFEGIYLGLALLWIGRRTKLGVGMLAGAAALWMGCALLPTAAAWAAYVAIGHGPEFVYANFTSILARGNVSASHASADFSHILNRLQPFLVATIFGEWLFRPLAPWNASTEGRAAHGFLIGWLIAAIVGFLIFGSYFNHYALPLLPPFAIASAPLFAIRHRGVGPVIAAVALLANFIAYPIGARKMEKKHGGAAYAATLAGEIAPRLHGGCLWIFYGEPILYKLTDSCVPTRFAFPFHLSLAREAPALGIDPAAETRRILGTKPPVIVDRLSTDDEINFPVQAIVRDALVRDYRLVYSFRHPKTGDTAADVDQVWERLPGR